MSRWRFRVTSVVAIAVLVGGAGSMAAANAETAAQHYDGTLADGAAWIADVPGDWNGTIILYSHGYGPLVAQDAPDDETQAALLDEGYALAGSSYSGNSWWALASAVDDQFGALRALEDKIGDAKRTIAWGTSMGGLVSALEAQNPRGELDGVLTTCGLVAGALNLNNYQLDGEYALAHLLAPEQRIKLVRYASQEDAAAAAAQLAAAVKDAQKTAEGRARIALGAALLNAPTWYGTDTAPGRYDYAAQEAAQQQQLVDFVLTFIMTGRYQIELAAGGNSAFNAGVDYRALLNSSARAPEVWALYRKAGLDLNADLATLTRDADVVPDPRAVVTLARTSMVTGHLRVPELNIHTTDDELVPVEQEDWYHEQVARAGSSWLLRQAFVDATGHCAFHPSETIAALHALEQRIQTGYWGDVATPARLNQAAAALGLGGPPRFIPFDPPRLVGGLGEPGRTWFWHHRW